MENNLVTRVEKIRHLTALWWKNTRSKPLLAICHLDIPQSFRERKRGREARRKRERPVRQSQGEYGTMVRERWERGRSGRRKKE